MKYYKKAILLTLLISSNLISWAQDGAYTYSLEKCIERAIDANFSIKISKNDLQIDKNNVTYAPFLPTLSLTSRQNQIKNDQVIYNDQGVKDKSNYSSGSVLTSANVSWRLFDGFSMFATREKQEELLSQGEYHFKASAENLVMKISGQYYLIISLQNQIKLLEELVKISEIRYNQALTRYKIGKDSGLEYKQAKIYLNSDSSKLLLQKENMKNAYIELLKLMNLPLDSKISINDTIIPQAQLELGKLVSSALENNTNLLIFRSGEKLSNIDVKLAKASRYPTLDFSTGYSYNLNESQLYSPKYNQSNGFNWGFSFSVPIFNGNEINRKISNAKILANNSKIEFEQAKQEIESQIHQLYNVYSNNLILINFEQESEEASAMNLDAAIEKYKLGALSGIEFRDIQLSYLDASDRKLKALYQTKISEISLRLLAGNLFSADLSK